MASFAKIEKKESLQSEGSSSQNLSEDIFIPKFRELISSISKINEFSEESKFIPSCKVFVNGTPSERDINFSKEMDILLSNIKYIKYITELRVSKFSGYEKTINVDTKIQIPLSSILLEEQRMPNEYDILISVNLVKDYPVQNSSGFVRLKNISFYWDLEVEYTYEYYSTNSHQEAPLFERVLLEQKGFFEECLIDTLSTHKLEKFPKIFNESNTFFTLVNPDYSISRTEIKI